MFDDSDTPTKYKRKEYRDSDTAEEFDLLPTSRPGKICLPLTANERAENFVNLPCCLRVLPAPGLSTEKAYKSETKLRRLALKHAKDYYNRIQFEHKAEMEIKKATKNKARNKAKKNKKAKITMANA